MEYKKPAKMAGFLCEIQQNKQSTNCKSKKLREFWTIILKSIQIVRLQMSKVKYQTRK